MRVLFLIAIVILQLSSSIEHVSGQVSLNGEWQFLASNTILAQDVLKNKSIDWDTINVPGNWDTQTEYSEYVGKGYYQRTFDVPKSYKGKQVRIKFNAVYQRSKVWVNGQFMGEHIGGYLPFDYNITDVIKVGKSNTVLVMADNTYKRGAWWAWGGISRDVQLIPDNDIRIVYQHITAVPDFETHTIQFVIDYKLENNSSKNSAVTISTRISDVNNNFLFTKYLKESVAGNSVQEYQIAFERQLSEFKLWNVENPILYKSHTTVSTKKVLDEMVDKFGVRKIEARGEQLFLNNEVLYANGLNRVHDHPNYGNTEPDHLVRADMLDIKALGGTMSRLMHAPLAENIIEFCDSIGFLLIEEIPVWGDDDPQAFKDNPQTKTWLNELITRDYNHPSVIGWSVGNELRQPDSIAAWGEKTLTKDQFEYINSMLDYVASLDTTRLKTYVGLTTYQAGTMENEPYEKLDLICINSYSDGVWTAEKTNEKFPGKPIFLSEIGIGQIGPAPDGALSEKLVNQLMGLRKLPFLVGASLWSYNDYRSNYKGTPKSGFREWGVVNELRVPKKAYEQIKEIYGMSHKK